jgi:O-methyltransferase
MASKITSGLKACVQGFLRRFGYRFQSLYDSVIDVDPVFMEIYRDCREYTLTTKERMFALYKATKYVISAGIEGNFVECGVWRGGSAMVIAYTLRALGISNRRIFLYDTFAGMSAQTDEDWAFGVKDKNDYQKSDASLAEVKKNMAKTGYDNFMYVEGKVEDTILDKSKHSAIALLRLDTDWYESTRHELINLYPILEKGGVLIVDDYGAWAGAKKAVDEYFKNGDILLNRIDRDSVIGIKIK